VVVGFLLSSFPLVGSGTAATAQSIPRSGDNSEIRAASSLLDPAGNFSMPLALTDKSGAATTTLPAGTVLTVAYRFKVVNFTADDLGLLVRVPGTVAVFGTPGAPLRLVQGAESFSINATGVSNGSNGTTSVVLSSSTTINASSNTPAHLSSEAVAVMDPLPWGSVVLNFTWNWTVAAPGVAPVWSSWGGAGHLGWWVVPAQYAQLARTSSKTMSAPGTFTACLAGSILGRNFTLQSQTVTSGLVLGQANVTVPTTYPLPYCWNEAIPTGVTPQLIQIHIFSYETTGEGNVSAQLLYVIPVTIVLASPTPGAGLFGVPLSTVLTASTVAAIVAAAAIALFFAVRYVRGRRPG
jgi:hypothetical protein